MNTPNMRKLRFIIMLLQNGPAVIAQIGVVVLTTLIAVHVIMRYIFNTPLSGAIEISGFLLVLIATMGLAYTLRTKGHVAITFLLGRLPLKVRGFLECFDFVLEIVFLTILLRSAWILTLEHYRNKSIQEGMLNVSLWIPTSVVVVGVGFLLLEYLSEAYRGLCSFWQRKRPDSGFGQGK